MNGELITVEVEGIGPMVCRLAREGLRYVLHARVGYLTWSVDMTVDGAGVHYNLLTLSTNGETMQHTKLPGPVVATFMRALPACFERSPQYTELLDGWAAREQRLADRDSTMRYVELAEVLKQHKRQLITTNEALDDIAWLVRGAVCDVGLLMLLESVPGIDPILHFGWEMLVETQYGPLVRS